MLLGWPQELVKICSAEGYISGSEATYSTPILLSESCNFPGFS